MKCMFGDGNLHDRYQLVVKPNLMILICETLIFSIAAHFVFSRFSYIYIYIY